jgi:hypothetical protein
MADSSVSFRLGEKRLVYGSASVSGGTLTISSAAATLYDSAGSVVSGWNGVAVSNQTSGAAATVQAGKVVDTAGLGAGGYLLVFTIAANGSDGLARTYEPAIAINVEAFPPTGRGYPTASDLAGYLTDQGISDTVGSGRLEQAISSAIAAFEKAVDRKMVADPVAVARTFSPPTDRAGLLFLPDFISLASIVYAPQNSTPQTFVLTTDYTLQPVGALTGSGDYAPYSAISFTRFWPQPMWPALANSLTITARWGYAASMPDDAWEAILGRAAGRLLAHLGVTGIGGTGGVTSRSGGGESVTYAAPGRYDAMSGVLEQNWNDAVQRYRRMSI